MIALLALAYADDPVVTGLQEELDRAMAELRLPDAPAPYFIAYRLEDQWRADVQASLGGIVKESTYPQRVLGVEVRVGSPAYDSSNFKAGFRSDDGHLKRSLVVADVPIAARQDAWLATDEAYKDAVANLSAKEAADGRRAEIDPTPDYTLGTPTEHAAEAADAPDLAELRAATLAVSEVFLEHPDVDLSAVRTSAAGGRFVVLDSEGTRVELPRSRVGLVISAQARAEDGARLSDSREFHVRTVDDLPDVPALEAAASELAQTLAAWRDAEVPEDPYIGPVLIEGDAATDAFRQLLLPALLGTPKPDSPSKGSRIVDFGRSNGAEVLGLKRRILPSGWAVVDDPTADPRSPAYTTHDEEGVPAQAVELVTDGIVRSHFAAKTPSKAVGASNGHGRAGLGELVRGRPMITTVTPPKVASAKKLHKAALKLSATYGNDHYLVIRRFPSGSTRVGVQTFSLGRKSALAEPTVVVRVYADGREEVLRNVAVEGLDRRALRDIVAAGTSTTRVFASGTDRFQVTAPTLLIDEVEVKPANESAEKPPPLDSPLARD